MRITKSTVIIYLTVTSCLLLVGCAKKMPECGEQNVQDRLNKVLVQNFEKQAAQLEEQYAKKEALQNFFYPIAPAINYKQNLNSIASQKQDKDIGKNYCSAANKSELSVDFKYKINPHYGGDNKELLEDASRKLKSQGENVKFEDDDTIVINTAMFVPDSIDYTAQISDSGSELIVKLGKE